MGGACLALCDRFGESVELMLMLRGGLKGLLCAPAGEWIVQERDIFGLFCTGPCSIRAGFSREGGEGGVV